MFELKDCVLEMTSAKSANITFALNNRMFEKITGIFEVMNRIMKLDDWMAP